MCPLFGDGGVHALQEQKIRRVAYWKRDLVLKKEGEIKKKKVKNGPFYRFM